jgi:predicted kinase
MKVIICRGIPASGKSTWAIQHLKENPNYKRINKDLLREMLDNSEYSKSNELIVKATRNSILCTLLLTGHDVILDDTNLHDKDITDITILLKNAGFKVEVEIKNFDISLATALARNKNRSKVIPEEVICKMYDRWLEIIGEKYEDKSSHE